jgi:hypothetical protein
MDAQPSSTPLAERGVAHAHHEITPKEWQWVRDLIADLERDGNRETCIKLTQLYGAWTVAVRMFRLVERERMFLGEPSEQDLQLHALCLYGLLTLGQSLRIAVDGLREELEKLEFNFANLEAYLWELRASLHEWHADGYSGEELETLRQRIFAAA